jgi:mono/diheme cytochrome c family protein
MNYPVWYLPGIGGGTLIAIIAVTHVFVSQFAVGGGLYLVLAERKGIRENDPDILEFVRKFTKFFILLTLVYGSITGVGIWFIISLVNPAATSMLIHNFVFGWASEWVVFLVEIVSITIYYYSFGRMDDRTHQAVGWIYFLSGWFSLFIINGIITFMLSPGGWKKTHDFWAGFFNPTFWPATCFRTFIALMLAGAFSLLIVSFQRNAALKRSLGRFSGKWVLLAFLGGIPTGYWYLRSLPGEARLLLEGRMPTINAALQDGLYAAVGLLVLTLIFPIAKPAWHNKLVSFLVLAGAFMIVGTFEWTRENARRPFVVDGSPGVLYTVSMSPNEMDAVQKKGFLRSARWTRFKKLNENNFLAAGEELFQFQCYACHTVGGLNNDIVYRTRGMTFNALEGYIERIHQIRYFMPPFAGNDQEAKALAAWIVKYLQGGEIPPMASLVGEEKTGKEPTLPGAPMGQAVFEEHCSFCHQLGEGSNPIRKMVAGWSRDRIRKALDRLPQLNSAMPPLNASPAEKDALADFLAGLGQGGNQ